MQKECEKCAIIPNCDCSKEKGMLTSLCVTIIQFCDMILCIPPPHLGQFVMSNISRPILRE